MEGDLFQLWMIYTSKQEQKNLEEFLDVFVNTYQGFIDQEYEHLNDGFSEESLHLTRLPDGILETLGTQLWRCSEQLQQGVGPSLDLAQKLLKCLIIISRNYDNVPLVASCEFVSYLVKIAGSVLEELCSGKPEGQHAPKDLSNFVLLTLHLFECLYDPYFVWRKRLRSWTVDSTRLKYRPALLHNEVVPFFYDCFQKDRLPSEIQMCLLHLFGAVISGAQSNALRAITPPTLDVLLAVLGAGSGGQTGPANSQRPRQAQLKALVLKCLVRMVHVIHACSPEQRQVEVGEMMQDYMKVLLNSEMRDSEAEAEMEVQFTMIDSVAEMLTCQDKGGLQVALVRDGTFRSFLELLQKTSLTGSHAQRLASSVLHVAHRILSGSGKAKAMFKHKVGYPRFLEALKSLGQPSQDLLQTLLDLVVEGAFVEGEQLTVHNTQVALLLLQWLPDIQSPDLQTWLARHLQHLCCRSNRNCINCCRDGMMSTIISILGRQRQISSAAVGHLISLLETLGSHSITAAELKQLIGLLHLDEENQQPLEIPYCTRLMRALSTMARRSGRESALHFFDLQHPGDGMSLPTLPRWPSQTCTLHLWLCLDPNLDSSLFHLADPRHFRRHLYSLSTSNGEGFEGFFTVEGELVVAVLSKKDFSAVNVPCPDTRRLDDGLWHCVTVVHSGSRRPFGHSQVSVYVDGHLRVSTQLRFPSLSEPLTACRVGAPGLRSALDLLPGSNPPPAEAKKQSPLKSLIQGALKTNTNHPDVTTVPIGTQDEIWGPPVTLCGQLGSLALLHDAASLSQARALYVLGPNHFALFNEDPDLSDLYGKVVAHYNAKACKDGVCADLSPHQHHAHMVGQHCSAWDVKDAINCIGGIQVLLPLLEQADRAPPLPPDLPDPTSQASPSPSEDWVMVPSSSYSDTKLEQNQVAAFLALLRSMLQTKEVNQDIFISTHTAATVGALLQSVPAHLVDVFVLMAVQLLVESSAAVNKLLLQHLYQFLLFDFRVWSKSEFPVRIGHIQYLSTIIKDDRKYFRKKFGVQYILDVVRTYYSSSCEQSLSVEDARTIRVSLLNLIKYYIMKDVTAEEVSSLISFLAVVKEESLICEVLDVVMALLESRGRQDQLYLLLYEPEMAELLYVLLTYRGYSVIFYEKVVKVLHILLKTDRVYEKSKGRLRLQDCGHWGLVTLMQDFDLSAPMVRRFIEQVSFVETSQTYSAILAILSLTHHSGLDIKLEASRQLLSLLVSKSGAGRSLSKLLGWQDTIVRLLILETPQGGSPKQTPASTPANSSTLVPDADKSPSNPTLTVMTSEPCDSNNSANCSLDNSIDLGDSLTQRPFVLDLMNPTPDSPAPKSPSTPMFVHAQQFEDLGSTDDDRSQSISRSSSTSVEDLSALGQRAGAG